MADKRTGVREVTIRITMSNAEADLWEDYQQNTGLILHEAIQLCALCGLFAQYSRDGEHQTTFADATKAMVAERLFEERATRAGLPMDRRPHATPWEG